MNEDVTSKLITIDSKEMPKQFFEVEWELQDNIDVTTIHLDNYVPSFSHRDEVVVNPISGWNILIRDGTEVHDLELAIKKFLSNAQLANYYGSSKPKLKIKFELNLGEIWISLIDNVATQELASFTRTVEAITTRFSNAHPSIFAEYDELYDLSVLVHGSTTFKSSEATIVTTTQVKNDQSKKTSIKVKKPRINKTINTTYLQFLTGEKAEIDKILAIFLNHQNGKIISDLSDDELALILQSRSRKMLPSTINGLRYIGKGQPRLVLGKYVLPFDGEEATKEANLAEIIFGKQRDITETVTYEEIFETLEGKNAENDEFAQIAGRKWLDLDKNEQKSCIKDYKQRMRQLNYRLGAMLGLGETKALVAVDSGIAIDHRLLQK